MSMTENPLSAVIFLVILFLIAFLCRDDNEEQPKSVTKSRDDIVAERYGRVMQIEHHEGSSYGRF